MGEDDRKYASIVINYFWGEGTTTPKTVTGEAVVVAFEALEQAKVCSRSMDLVPRPQYGVINLKYPLTQIVKIGKRIADGDTGIYMTCKNVVGVRYKTRVAAALLGVY